MCSAQCGKVVALSRPTPEMEEDRGDCQIENISERTKGKISFVILGSHTMCHRETRIILSSEIAY